MKLLPFFFILTFLFAGPMAKAQTEPEQSPVRVLEERPAPREEEPLTWRDKIRFGGSFGGQFGSFTNINISPLVGYNISDGTTVGGGVSYIYTKVFNSSFSYFGGRGFVMRRVFPNIFAQAEYEFLSVPTSRQGERKWVGLPMIGGSYSQPISGRFALNFTALYNLNFTGNPNAAFLPYNSPWVIRVSFF